MANKIQISYEELASYKQGVSGELKIGVAISGGRDSVVLLHCLKAIESESISRSPKLKIIAVNIEHGIRGEESISDAAFVKDLCEKWNVPLFAYGVNAVKFAGENGYTLEQAARILRYEIFDKLIAEGQCDLIALAHHLDDQVETVFMRILRGTGIRGLTGMKKVSGRYIRPFLGYGRESIDEYIKEHGLSYVEDGTNSDTAYTRNYLRQELAELKKRFPQMGEAVARLTASADEANEFINAQVPKIEVKDSVSYIKTADCANSVIAKRLILKAANALGVMQDIEDRHYALVLGLLSAENGKYLTLTHGLCVHKESDRLAFTVKDGNINGELKTNSDCGCTDDRGSNPNGCDHREREFTAGVFNDLGVTVELVDKASAVFGTDTLYIDADKIPCGAVIRGRRDGDCIHKFGGGSKSLGDFLTDKKIPLRIRDGLKVIAKDNQVYAVFGVDVSADVKIDGDTVRVYALKVIKKQ